MRRFPAAATAAEEVPGRKGVVGLPVLLLGGLLPLAAPTPPAVRAPAFPRVVMFGRRGARRAWLSSMKMGEGGEGGD